MPVVTPERKPDYELSLDVKKEATRLTAIPCEVWLPAGPDEKPIFRFTSRDQGHFSLIGGPYEVDGTIYSFDKKPAVLISANGVWFEGVSSRSVSGNEPSIVSGFGLPEKLITAVLLSDSATGDEPLTHLHFDLSENQLLAPTQIIETSYTGNRTVRTVHTQRIDVHGLGRLRFTKHYHERKSKAQPRQWTVADTLVAETKLNVPAHTLIQKDSQIRSALEDCLLIASFAARQRTIAPAWHAADQTHLVKCYAGNISIPEQKAEPSIHDVLIDLRDFSGFFGRALKRYNSLAEPERRLLRDALYKALPSPGRTLETRYLMLFSALESIVLWFRRHNDFEYTIPESGNWKVFNRDVRSLIKSHVAISDESRRHMMFDMIGGLRRVPLRHAFLAYCKCLRVQVSDLWPVFGRSGCLNEIRNKLSHGDTYGRPAFQALVYAQANLEVLVERMLLAALRWPSARSNVSEAHLKAYGWKANLDLERHMAVVKNQGRDFDALADE